MADFPQDVSAPLNYDTDTYFFHTWLVEAIIDGLSPVSQKLFLTDAYCRHWISGDQVEQLIFRYGLEGV
ncbi:MAG: hypothetical protein ACR2QF_07265 [Geminicoccaceae bacterium]